MEFVVNEPALIHKGALIIGDTHFGIEEKLKKGGIHYQNASEHTLKHVISLIKKTRAKRLIILGDVKEKIEYVDPITRRAFEKLQKIIPVTVVRGNHDGGVETVCNDVKPSEGMLFDTLGLVHGNAWPANELMEAEYIVAAHAHPQVSFRDTLGKRHHEAAWFVLPSEKSNIEKYYEQFNEKIELILLPAFNLLAGKALRSDARMHRGPLLHNKLFKLDDALVFQLDGTMLGKLKNIEE